MKLALWAYLHFQNRVWVGRVIVAAAQEMVAVVAAAAVAVVATLAANPACQAALVRLAGLEEAEIKAVAACHPVALRHNSARLHLPE